MERINNNFIYNQKDTKSSVIDRLLYQNNTYIINDGFNQDYKIAAKTLFDSDDDDQVPVYN